MRVRALEVLDALKEQRAFSLLAAYAAAMPAVMSVVGVWFVHDIVRLFESAGAWAVPLFAGVTTLALALALLPANAMAGLAGALFGVPGVVLAVVSYLAACLLAFEAMWRVVRPAVQRRVRRSPRLWAFQEECRRFGWKFVTLARIAPGVPFAMMNVVLAAAPLGRGSFLLGSLVGLFPRMALWVGIGAATQTALDAIAEGRLPDVDERFRLMLLALWIVGALGLAWYATRAMRRAIATADAWAGPKQRSRT